MAQARTFVALDVHAAGGFAAIIDGKSGELRRQRLSGRANSQLRRDQAWSAAGALTRLTGAIMDLLAGPTWLAMGRRRAIVRPAARSSGRASR